MKLEIGLYVRDEDYGIGRVTDICKCEKCKERGYYEPRISFSNHSEGIPNRIHEEIYLEDHKFSFDVTDLLQEGDYVNGYIVIDFTYSSFNGKRIAAEVDNEFKNINKNEIKTILTKEQYENSVYRIEE